MTSAPLPAGWIPPDTFALVVATLPLVSIDLVLTDPAGRLLLGCRRNRPAQDHWFTPGGRIHRLERFAAAQARIGLDEVGLAPVCWQRARPLGVYDHFYDDCAVSDAIATHYVNHPYAIALSSEEAAGLRLVADTQHSAWRWMEPAAAATAADVHPYAQAYARLVAPA